MNKRRQPKKTPSRYGVVFDVGTITVVGGIVDLGTKKELASLVRTNPQVSHGEDIISRIGYSIKEPRGLKNLNSQIIGCLNQIIKEFKDRFKIGPKDIEKIVCVGNAAIEHFLLGIHPKKLVAAPYRSNLPDGIIKTTAKMLGLEPYDQTPVILLPIIKGFVGSDLTAGILHTQIHKKMGVNLIIDLGANGEMALSKAGALYVTSTAAGPAFEGGNISCGMRAQEGAISSVKIEKARAKLKVIGNTAPKGLCGSGVIEAASEMLRNAMIEKDGRLKEAFILYNKKGLKIAILPDDIRQLQLAKAAIRAGISVLTGKAGVPLNMLNRIYIAGMFGSFLDREAAIRIGLIPPIKRSKIKVAGNTAYKGALKALLEKRQLGETEEIAKSATHLNLFARKDFQEEFVNRMHF